MSVDTAGETARRIMAEFARRTGLDPPSGTPKRYLWTDAFAACNYLGLSSQAGHESCRDLALRLVDQVHHTLGMHREDDPRKGWISGLPPDEGERHPAIGGLRIGKRLPERKPGEPPDERLEWDQDGQYFHYLTKWMHALERVGRATGDPGYLRWAMELAQTAHARFTTPARTGRPGRMYWKMSIDLSRPLVASMGQHDPLDGFITCCALQLAAREIPGPSPYPDLRPEIADFAGICRGIDLATDDPLGTGGLLTDALRIAHIMDHGGAGFLESLGPGLSAWFPVLLGDLMDAAITGLDDFAGSGNTRLPAEYRLAFRELGLSIGLAGVKDLGRLVKGIAGDSSLEVQAEAVGQYLPVGDSITRFWLDERNRQGGSWVEHREINMVMLATSLAPGGFLGLPD